MPEAANVASTQSGDPLPAQRRRSLRLWQLYLATLTLFAIVVAFADASFRDDWTVGDWLINYANGFVRRGLMGEIFLRLASLFHCPAAYFIVPLEVFCYASLYGGIAFLIRNARLPIWQIALLVSPAGILFEFRNPTAGNHKEVLLFATLSCLIVMLSHLRLPDWAYTLFLSAACVVIMLTHEGMMFYLPYLFAAIAIAKRPQKALRIGLLPAILVLVCAAAAYLHPGDASFVQVIGHSLGYESEPPTLEVPESIQYLAHPSSAYAHQVVLRGIRGHFFPRFYWLVALALAPILLGIWTLAKDPSIRRPLMIFLTAAASSAATSSFLFYYGVDWDRWIYIHVLCCTFLLFYLATITKTKREPIQPSSRTPQASLTALLALFLYATTWLLSTLPEPYPLWSIGHFAKHWLTSPRPPLPRTPE